LIKTPLFPDIDNGVII